MAKLSDLLTKTSTIKEGKYTAHIISISKADPIAYDNKDVPIILKVKFPELADRVQTIFLNTKKASADDLNIYERTIVDIERQLQTGKDMDLEQIESVDINFKGKDVDCYVCNVLATDGKTYTNYYFNKENKHVKAMLLMM